MKKNSYHSPAPQTIQALDHCRKEYADTLGVSRNAVDQLFAGNTHDAYPPFREQFQKVCLTAEAIPDVYLDDLQAIKQQARGGAQCTIWEAYMDKLTTAHNVIETVSRALKDGTLDYGECVELIPLLSKMESTACTLKQAVIDRKNELSAMPNREFAQAAARRRA